MRRGGLVAVAVAMTAAAGGGAATAAPAASPELAEWRFDEAAGQRALDSGPLGLDGRLGATDDADAGDPERIAGRSGGALRFTGTSFVRLPDAPELAPATLTVEAVVRAPRSPGSWSYIVSRGGQQCLAGSYGLYTGEAGGAAFYVFDGSRYWVTPTARPGDVWDDGWHHVAGVYDGSSVRLFVDGRPVGGAAAAPPRIAYALSARSAFIGTYQGSCSRPLIGDLDLVRMWSGPLSGEWVAALAAEALGQPPPPPGSVPAPLPPAAPGTSIRAPAPAPGASPPKTAPGAPPRACVVRPSTRRVRVGRRSVVRVTVRYRKRALRRVKVVVRRSTGARIAVARTDRLGRARVRLRPTHVGRLAITVPARRGCNQVSLRVTR